jgi:A/G-specific adenine glycosylase
MRQKKDFSKPLIMWYLINRRELPWRKTADPYQIWLSEIILQQTRIAQGTAYFEKFIDEFPTVFELANADEKKVLKLWQGLGYYSRARNLHITARKIAEELNGEFPGSHKELLALKGVGDYTASAIASIAFELPHAVVDGNVYRVLSRFFGISTPIDSVKGSKEFKALAQDLLDPEQPGNHNQAVMELGALVCTPRGPKCDICPLKSNCFASLHGRSEEFPVKQGKVTTKKRYFNYLVLDAADGFTKIRKRTDSDIWKHLYEFPLVESDGYTTDPGQVQGMIAREFDLSDNYTLKKFNPEPVVHKLSHQELHTDFWVIKTDETTDGLTKWTELNEHALPVLLQKFVDKYRDIS